jgi:hypothetical protein
MMHYFAYNLRITSEIPLPELPPSDCGGDVEVRLNPPRELAPARSISWSSVSPAESRFCYPGAGRFVIREGRSIEVTPEPNVDLELLRLYVEGMMLAALLDQRGYFVLHASIVNIGGYAIGFVGPVGAGKSTLAAGFHARGRPVAADDNAAVDLSGSDPMILPGFPSVKIYPEIAIALGYSRESLRSMHSSQIKQARSVSGGFAEQPLPLGAIYVLDRDAAAGVCPLSAMEPLVELIRHSVPTRWGVAGDGAHLHKCSRLSQSVPLFRLRTFTGLPEIAEVLDRIEDHCSRFAGTMVERAAN